MEITSAWLNFVQKGQKKPSDPRALSWAQYQALLSAFEQDAASGKFQVVAAEDFNARARRVQEQMTVAFLEGSQVPIVHAHDAYYIAVGLWLKNEVGCPRVVLVTNDRGVWAAAKSLELEAFHGNTCDLGTGVLNVGLPDHNFPMGAACSPCAVSTCPSNFVVDLKGLPPDLGSGSPRTGPQITRATAADRAANP